MGRIHSMHAPYQPYPAPAHGTPRPYSSMQYAAPGCEHLDIPLCDLEHLMAHLSPAGVESFMRLLYNAGGPGFAPLCNHTQAYSGSQALQHEPSTHSSDHDDAAHGHLPEGDLRPSKRILEHEDSVSNGADNTSATRSESPSVDLAAAYAPIAMLPEEYHHFCKNEKFKHTKETSTSKGVKRHGDGIEARDRTIYYCKWCSNLEHWNIVPFERIADANRHVRQFHIEDGFLWRHGGFVTCPFSPECNHSVPIDRHNTIKDHLVQKHYLPHLPERDEKLYESREKGRKRQMPNGEIRHKIRPETQVKIKGKRILYVHTANYVAEENLRRHEEDYRTPQREIKKFLAEWYRLHADRDPYTRLDSKGQKLTPKPRSGRSGRARNCRPRRGPDQQQISPSTPSTPSTSDTDSVSFGLSQRTAERVDSPMASVIDGAHQLFIDDVDGTRHVTSSYQPMSDSTLQDPFAFPGASVYTTSGPLSTDYDGIFDGQTWTYSPMDCSDASLAFDAWQIGNGFAH